MLQTLGHLPMGWLSFTLLAAPAFLAFYMGRNALSTALVSGTAALHSRLNYYGYYAAMCTLVPGLLVLLAYHLLAPASIRAQLSSELPDYMQALSSAELNRYLDKLSEHAGLRHPPDTGNQLFDMASRRLVEIEAIARLIAFLMAGTAMALGYGLAMRRIQPGFRARSHVEFGGRILLFICAGIAVLTTFGIIFSLLFETLLFFSAPGAPTLAGFLFGLDWNAQTGETFGALPLFFGTVMIAVLAMAVAAPIGLMSAIYLSEYASPRLRAWVKPVLELLAGIPTVVYGFFAALILAPVIRSGAEWVNALPFVPDGFLAAQPQSALAAGLIMGIMIIPFVSSLSDDIIQAVPQTLRDGALAVGSTRSETIKQVVLPAALPGIIASFLLAVSRAIGETMIVVMAAGQRAQITLDPTSDLTTVTAQIVALLTGDTEFDSAKTLSAFALGFLLFAVTLIFNLIALRIVRRYQEKYD